MTQQTVFCGRERDLDQLEQAWRVVAGERRPQLVLLLAESGLGKTRLLQAFYARLAERYRSEAGAGYWPPRLGQSEQNLTVNPDLSEVDGTQVMPFLWWGLRLVDPEGRNQVASGAVAGHLGALTPHLQPMYRARRHKRRWLEGGKIAGGAALGFIPIVSDLLDLGQAAFELEQLRREERRDQVLTPEQAEHQELRDLNDRILSDLGQLLRDDRSGAAIPMVWAIDDAHFSPADPGLVALVEGVLGAAQREGWPLLILVTHWEQEWHAQRRDAARASVAHAIEEGYRRLDPGWQPQRLAPISGAGLAPALEAALPGLAADQAARLLERAGGNPRFLDEVVRLCRGRPRYFVDRDPGGPLSERGLEAVLAASTSLHALVEARLQDAPPAVRTLVTLSSLQGMRLLYLVSHGVLGRLLERGYQLQAERPREALELARTPYAFLNLLDGHLAEFSQRVFFEVAREGLEDLVDPEDALAALTEVLRDLLGRRPESQHQLSETERGLLLELGAEVLAGSGEPADRQFALTAVAELLRLALDRFDYRGALELAERMFAGAQQDRWRLLELSFLQLWDLQAAFKNMGRLTEARATVLAMRWVAETSGDEGDLGDALFLLASVDRTLGDLDAALEHYRASFELRAALAARQGTPEAKLALVMPTHAIVSLLQMRGELDGALEHGEMGLALARELAETHPTPEVRRDLAALLSLLGGVQRTRGELDAALELERSSLDLRERLVETMGTPSAKRELWASHNFLGNLCWERREPQTALQHYRSALDLARAMADEEGTPDARRLLSWSHGFVADLLLDLDEPEAALDHYLAGLTIARELAEALATPEARADLATALDGLGGLQERSGELDAAYHSYFESLDIRYGLAEELATPAARRDVSTSLLQVGDTYLARGGHAAALEFYRTALDLARGVADSLGTPAALLALGVAHRKVATALETQGDVAALREALAAGLEVAQALLASATLPGADELAAWFRERLAEPDRD